MLQNKVQCVFTLIMSSAKTYQSTRMTSRIFFFFFSEKYQFASVARSWSLITSVWLLHSHKILLFTNKCVPLVWQTSSDKALPQQISQSGGINFRGISYLTLWLFLFHVIYHLILKLEESSAPCPCLLLVLPTPFKAYNVHICTSSHVFQKKYPIPISAIFLCLTHSPLPFLFSVSNCKCLTASHLSFSAASGERQYTMSTQWTNSIFSMTTNNTHLFELIN